MFKTIANLARCIFTPKQRKIQFLRNKIYDYYYTIFSTRIYTNTQNSVNIPDFILVNKAKSLAVANTTRELEKVINDCRVNQCFANAIK